MVGDDTNRLGETLRHYRERAGRSVADLAGAAGLDRAYLRRLETQAQDWLNQPLGQRPLTQPSRDVLIRLGVALQLRLDELDDLLVTGGYAPLVAPERAARAKARPVSKVA